VYYDVEVVEFFEVECEFYCGFGVFMVWLGVVGYCGDVG